MSGGARSGEGYSDPGTAEVVAEAQDNRTRAEIVDETFAEQWAGHLREVCVRPVLDDPSEASMYEACRRAFREGFHLGAGGRV